MNSIGRPKNSSKFESYHSIERGIAVAILYVAVMDYNAFGKRTRRTLAKHGPNWNERNRLAQRGEKYVSGYVRELRKNVSWLYTRRFGYICDVLDLDAELVQEKLLEQLMGIGETDGALLPR